MDLEDCLITEDDDLKFLGRSGLGANFNKNARGSTYGNPIMDLIQTARTTNLTSQIRQDPIQYKSDSEGSLDEMMNPYCEEISNLKEHNPLNMNRSSQVSTTCAESWPLGFSPTSSMSLVRVSPEEANPAKDELSSIKMVSVKTQIIEERIYPIAPSSKSRLFQEDASEEPLPTSLLGKRSYLPTQNSPASSAIPQPTSTSSPGHRLTHPSSGSTSRSSSALTCLKSSSDSGASGPEDCVVLESESTPLKPPTRRPYSKSHHHHHPGSSSSHKPHKKGPKSQKPPKNAQILLNRALLPSSVQKGNKGIKGSQKHSKTSFSLNLTPLSEALEGPFAAQIKDLTEQIEKSNNKKVKKRLARVLEKDFGVDAYGLLPKEVLLEISRFASGCVGLPKEVQDQESEKAKVECACEKGGCKDKKCVCSKYGKRCGLECRCRNCYNPSQIKRLKEDQNCINDLKEWIEKSENSVAGVSKEDAEGQTEHADKRDQPDSKVSSVLQKLQEMKNKLKSVQDKYSEVMQAEISERFEREKKFIESGESSNFISIPDLIDDPTYIVQVKMKLKEEILDELVARKHVSNSKHNNQSGSGTSKKQDSSQSKSLDPCVNDSSNNEANYRSSDSQDGGSDSYGLGKLGRGKYARIKLLKIHCMAVIMEMEFMPFMPKAECLKRGVVIATWKSISTMRGVRFKKLRDADPKLVEMIASEKKKKAMLKKREAKRATFRESDGDQDFDDEEDAEGGASKIQLSNAVSHISPAAALAQPELCILSPATTPLIPSPTQNAADKTAVATESGVSLTASAPILKKKKKAKVQKPKKSAQDELIALNPIASPGASTCKDGSPAVSTMQPESLPAARAPEPAV